MRLNPEDYAFLAFYSPARVDRAAGARRARAKGTLISLGLTVLIMAFWWFQQGKQSPSDVLTWWWLGLLAVTAVVTAASALMTAMPARLVALAGLVAPIVAWWMLWWRLRALDADGTTPRALAIGALVLAIAGVGCLAASLIAALRWMREPAGMGWVARRLGQISIYVALGPAILFAVAWLAVGSRLGSAGWINDQQIWVSCAIIAIAAIVANNAAQQAADFGVLAAAVQQRPALRIDPLGLVLDEPAGPVRVPWDMVRGIDAKARSLLPGPQLRVHRAGAPDWLVPMSYLDCMPGTIDSAIRSHTTDRRCLDLSALDRIC
jgi:hypothetical protein